MSTPEITSVMKTFSFIRAALFRKIGYNFQERPDLMGLVDHSHPTQADPETYTIDLLKNNLQQMAPEMVELLESTDRTRT